MFRATAAITVAIWLFTAVTAEDQWVEKDTLQIELPQYHDIGEAEQPGNLVVSRTIMYAQFHYNY